MLMLLLTNGIVLVLLVGSRSVGPYDWIRDIESGPSGRKIQLEAKTYLIDRQYQLPSGTELRGAGTARGHRTVIKASGAPYNACAGTASKAGAIQGRRGLLLGDDSYVGGFHFIGMETVRLDCLYAPIETPGCLNSEGNFPSPPNAMGPAGPAGRNVACGGYSGNNGHGVRNATVEDVTVEPYTVQNMFFIAPTRHGARVSRDITVRAMRVNGTWADGVNIHGQHRDVVVEHCSVVNSGDDCFALWSIGTGLDNVTFRNNYAQPRPGCNCCYVNFGGLRSTFVDNRGHGCGLTPECAGVVRPNIPPGSAGLVVFGSPTNVPGLFGGAWNRSSVATVRNMTGSCAGGAACPTCVLTAHHMYPGGFPGTATCLDHPSLRSLKK